VQKLDIEYFEGGMNFVCYPDILYKCNSEWNLRKFKEMNVSASTSIATFHPTFLTLGQ